MPHPFLNPRSRASLLLRPRPQEPPPPSRAEPPPPPPPPPAPLGKRAAAERAGFLLRSFRRSAACKEQALAQHIPDGLFARASVAFARVALEAMAAAPGAAVALAALPGDAAAHAALFPFFADFARERYPAEVAAHAETVRSLDLRRPHLWFPVARALRRRVIYHAGPTNSGKTYNALAAMRAAASGVYCGPLRLLAMEVYDTCNGEGTFCSLVTGQERREVPGAAHAACTVEMVDMQARVEVAVIDEIQVIGDAGRGWAWTRALLGVPAAEVHVCGDASAVGLVRALCEATGEPFEVRAYERFAPLEVARGGLEGGYASARPGDCVVAFSRREIYGIKARIEAATPHRACIIYGALPPETRRHQARLFNDPDNEYAVMVASDAVGMGLNLNIGRVVFHTLTKQEGGGRGPVPVSTSMVKQIAGRAGRRSSQFARGAAATLEARDAPRLAAELAKPPEALATPRAGLFPEFEHFEVFAGRRPELPFAALLAEFAAHAVLEGRYFFCRQDSVLAAAGLLADVAGLSLRDTYTFCMAPASASDLRIAAALLHFARLHAAGQPCVLDVPPPVRAPASPDEMRLLESAHQVVMLWLWLSYRFDDEAFPGRPRAQALGELLCERLAEGLLTITELGKAGGPAAGAEEGADRDDPGLLGAFQAEFDVLLEAKKRGAKEQRAAAAAAAREGRGQRRRGAAAAEAEAAEDRPRPRRKKRVAAAA
jgi:ATP-dependent RNA helicase SUPV3L1/SUV3